MDRLYSSKLSNQEVYGTDDPPIYDLKRIREETDVKIGMFVGQYDLLATVTDSRWTRD